MYRIEQFLFLSIDGDVIGQALIRREFVGAGFLLKEAIVRLVKRGFVLRLSSVLALAVSERGRCSGYERSDQDEPAYLLNAGGNEEGGDHGRSPVTSSAASTAAWAT